MFKKIIIIAISVILLIQAESFAQRGGGGRGGRGGFGNFPTPVFDANSFRSNALLNYLQDANGVKVDPNTVSDAELETLYNRISRRDTTVLDTSRLTDIINVAGGAPNMGGRGAIQGNPPTLFPQESDPNDPNYPVYVNLSQVGIGEIIPMLMNWTRKTIYPSPEALASSMMITIYSPDPMPRSRALSLLYRAMADQGFVAEETDDWISIKPASQIQRNNYPLVGENESLQDFADKSEVVRKIFRLRNYTPSAMGQIIYPFLDSFGYLTADDSTGTLMITDSIDTLMRIQLIIQQFDVKLANTITETIQVQHRDPQEMADLLTSIMANNSITSSGMLGGGGFNMGMMGGRGNNRAQATNARQARGNTNTRNQQQQRGRGGNTTTGMVGIVGAASATAMSTGTAKPDPIFIPESRSMSIIVRATAEDMVVIREWVAKLDTEAKIIWNPIDLTTLPKGERVEKFYYLQYNSPSQIATIVEPLLTDSGYITAEENTGTLLVIDTAEVMLQIEAIINKFDVPESEPAVSQIFDIKNGGDPKEIADLINMILTGSGATTGSTRTGLTTGRTTGRTTTGRTTTGRTTGGFGGRGG